MFFEALEENYRILEKYLNVYINDFNKKNKRKINLNNVNKCLGIFKDLFSHEGWNIKILNDFEIFLKDTLILEKIDNVTMQRIKAFLKEINKVIKG